MAHYPSNLTGSVSDGTIPIGSTSTGYPQYGTITAGTGISVTNGSNSITIAASGGTTLPSFLAKQLTDQTNVTGDGTAYTVTFTTVVYDNSSNFSGNTTFTAPVSGHYLFGFSLVLTGVTAGMVIGTIDYSVNGGTILYRATEVNVTAVSAGVVNVWAVSGSQAISLSATNTVVLLVNVIGAAKVITVQGQTASTVTSPTFWGYQVA